MTAPKAAGDKPAAPAEPTTPEPAPAEPTTPEPARAEPTVSPEPDPAAAAKAARKKAKKKAKKKAAKAATREHDHDAPPLWLDQVEGDGPTRRAFRSCQVAGCTVRVELGKVTA